MKTLKNQLLLFTTISFVALFYGQDMGVNLSIFSLIVWSTLLFIRRGIYKDKSFILLSISIFVSAAAFAWYGDFISFVALYLSLIITGFYALFQNKLNVLNLLVLLPLNYSSFIVRIFFLDKWLLNKNKMTNTRAKLFAYYIIPAFFAIVFLIVYSNSSKILSDFFRNIAIDFNLGEVIILTITGFFFMFSYYHFFVPRLIIKNNTHMGDSFTFSSETSMKPTFQHIDISFERKSGEITLLLLNIMLLIFLVIYNIEHFTAEASGTLSDSVHERIYTIIFSIVLAVSVILFYFKNTFNFDREAKRLRLLAYVWIILNLLLIVSAVFANMNYIAAYGLSFKRTGVYIFLLLSVAGLFFTFIKIKEKKTNIYLIKNMLWTVFVVLVINSVINWSWIITQHSIKNMQHPDLHYLYDDTRYNRKIFYDNYKDALMRNYQGYEQANTYKGAIKNKINYEKSKPFLSKKLYYQFIELE